MSKLIKSILEWAGPVAAIICLIDCIVLPVILAFAPFVGLHSVIHGLNDQAATLVVVTLCTLAFSPGLLRHRSPKVAILAASGICLVFFANLLGENADKGLHALLSIIGSGCLIRANFVNRKLLAASCACGHD